MNFTVGQSYTNEKGTYKVICEGYGKHKGKITVKFEDGTVTVLSKEEESKKATAKKEAAALPMSKKIVGRSEAKDYYTFLGMLAADSHVQVLYPENKRNELESFYMGAKGCALPETGAVSKSDNKWGVECRLNFSEETFKYMPNLSFANIIACPHAKLGYQINCNSWIYELVESGFDFGNKHDAARVEASVPVEHREAFRFGLEFGNVCAAESKAA